MLCGADIPLNVQGQLRFVNEGVPESLEDDPPCRPGLHLLHKLINDLNEAILRITVLLNNCLHCSAGEFQHATQNLCFCLHIKQFLNYFKDIVLSQQPQGLVGALSWACFYGGTNHAVSVARKLNTNNWSYLLPLSPLACQKR